LVSSQRVLLIGPQYSPVLQEVLLGMATMRKGGGVRAGYWTVS
jgi:hypothetical protein